MEATFYDKLLETLVQVGVKGCLNDPMFPYITQISSAFKEKLDQILKNNPKKNGKTRKELRIFSPWLQTSHDYKSFVNAFNKKMQIKNVLFDVKM